jgi:hypothetical protein
VTESPRLLAPRLVALSLLLAPLLEIVEAVLSPLRDSTTTADITAIAAHEARFTISVLAGISATALYVPAFLGIGYVTADRSRRLTTVATSLLILAMLGFAGVRMGQAVELAAVHQHTAPAVAGALLDATAGTAPGVVLMVLFLLGSTLGLWLLAVALWRSRAVARAAALAVAAFPLIDLGLKGHVATIASHVVLLAGLGAVGMTLLTRAAAPTAPAGRPVIAEPV